MARDDPPFVSATLAEQRAKLRGAPAQNDDEPQAESPRMEVFDLGDLGDITAIPPRQWLLGRSFCRTFGSSLIGSGAVGKTSVRYAQYLALASGRPITGERVYRRCRVLVICLEDDVREIRRRFAALLKHYGIEQSEVRGWLQYANPAGFKIAAGRGSLLYGGAQTGDLLHEVGIRQEDENTRYDLISVDPFVKSHDVEENDNSAIDAVMTLITRFASRWNCALDLPHHEHKGTPAAGDAGRGRGASSAVDAQRLAYTLTRMTAEEAQQFGVAEAERKQYVRLDTAKVNLAPAGEAQWFRLVSVPLGNGTPDYPEGDHIQAAESWHPPDIWAGALAKFAAIFDDIDAGLPNGQRYSISPNAGARAAWPVVQRHLDRTEAQARHIITTWVKDRVLQLVDYDDPVSRKTFKGLLGNLAKRPG